MLLPFLIVSFVLVIVLVAGFVTRNSLRVESVRLNLQLANVTASRDAMTKAYEGMKEIAAKAIDAARESEVNNFRVSDSFSIGYAKGEADPAELFTSFYDCMADPDPHSVKFCEKCNVSVRGTVWPVDCPACGYPIGDVLDADEIG